ncbi:hypothetical protein STANM309S_04739 [Streptomyces tanashiensis]
MVFVVLCLFLGGAAGTNKISDEESGVGESGRAGRITASGHFTEKPEENVLITASNGGKLDPATARQAAAGLTGKMRALPEVESVGTPLPSPDGKALLLPVTMKGDAENADTRVQPLLDASAATEKAHEGIRIDQIGTGSTAKGLGETLGADFEKAELISLPLTLLILLVVFGTIIAAGVPVLLALSCVGAAIGLSTLASHVLPETSAVGNVILLMGMAVGVDYSLFHLKREREERRKGASHLDAIEIAAETSGHTVVVSGTTVIVSMAGLYLAQEATFASLATGSIIVVAVAVLASLTVLPALLAKLGRWVDRPKVPLLWRLTMRSHESRVWPVLLRPALVRPALTLVVSVGALLALALPALDMKLKQPGSDDLSRDIPVVQAMDRLTSAFPSKGTVHQVAVRAPAERAGEVEAALKTLLRRTEGQGLFAHDQTPTIRASADKRVHTVAVGTPHSPRSDGARKSLELLRAWVPQALAPVRDAEAAVGGKVAQGVDFTGHLEDRMPWVVGFVLLLTFATMALIFRSLAVALSAILLNLRADALDHRHRVLGQGDLLAVGVPAGLGRQQVGAEAVEAAHQVGAAGGRQTDDRDHRRDADGDPERGQDHPGTAGAQADGSGAQDVTGRTGARAAGVRCSSRSHLRQTRPARPESSTTSPSRKRTRRGSDSAMSWSWVMTHTAVPAAFSSCRSSITSSRTPCRGRPWVRRRAAGPAPHERPGDGDALLLAAGQLGGPVPERCPSPTLSSAVRARARRSRGRRPRRAARRRRCRRRRARRTGGSPGTRSRCGGPAARTTGRPTAPRRPAPRRGPCRPSAGPGGPMMCSMVDLPEPEGPTMADRPARRSGPPRAGRAPVRVGFEAPRSSTTGGTEAAPATAPRGPCPSAGCGAAAGTADGTRPRTASGVTAGIAPAAPSGTVERRRAVTEPPPPARIPSRAGRP